MRQLFSGIGQQAMQFPRIPEKKGHSGGGPYNVLILSLGTSS